MSAYGTAILCFRRIAYGVDLGLLHGVLLEAIHVGEGSAEAGRGHETMR